MLKIKYLLHRSYHIFQNCVRQGIIAVSNQFTLYGCEWLTRFKCILLRAGGIKIIGVAFLDRGFRCIQPHNITIEDKVSLGHDNHIWAFTPVRIGHHTMSAKDLLIISASHDANTFEPIAGQEIEIGPGCWFGARVTILGGVKIGKGCIIGAGSIVKNSIPDWSIAAGVPAKVIRKREPAETIWHYRGHYAISELD
jgi:acetyltransferase-like isoleucine patch superfamily enzyme